MKLLKLFTENEFIVAFYLKKDLFPNLPPSFRTLLNLSSVVWHAKLPLQVLKSSRKSDEILKKKKVGTTSFFQKLTLNYVCHTEIVRAIIPIYKK